MSARGSVLKICKRKKMKTQRLITIVAVVALVLSLSVVGIAATGTSVAAPKVQVVKNGTPTKLPTLSQFKLPTFGPFKSPTVNTVSPSKSPTVNTVSPSNVQDPSKVQVVHNVVTPVVNLYHRPTPPPFPTPTPQEPIFTWFSQVFSWFGLLFNWIVGFL